MRRNKVQIIVVAVLCISISSLAIAYAALSTTLSIQADVQVESSKLDVSFLSNSLTTSTTGEATMVTSGTINNTEISDISVNFKYPGDSVTASVTAVNNNQHLYAKLSDVILIEPTCETLFVGEDQLLNTLSIEEGNSLASSVCEFVSIKVYYPDNVLLADSADNGYDAPVSVTELTSKLKVNGTEPYSETISFEIGYSSDSTIAIPENYSVKITGIGLNLIYKQVDKS